MTTVKSSAKLTLRDRLSRLNFTQASKLLGPEGKKLIQQGGLWEFQLDEDAYLGDDLFRLKFPAPDGQAGPIVTITLMAEARDRLHWRCDHCPRACEHVGAAFSVLLEDKMQLGLAAPPPERVPVESLSEAALVKLALANKVSRLDPSLLPSFSKALAEYRRSLEIEADYPQIAVQLGALELYAGRLKEARDAYRIALRRDPQHAAAYFGLGVVDVAEGKPQDARRNVRRAVELSGEESYKAFLKRLTDGF